MTKEVEINKKIGESTKITLTLKNFLWSLLIFKLIVIAASWFILWYLGNDIKDATSPLMKKTDFGTWQEKKFDPHLKDATGMQGDIKVLLDRTNSRGDRNRSTRDVPETLTQE